MEHMLTKLLSSGSAPVKRIGLIVALLTGCTGWAQAQANDECAGAINLSDGLLLTGQSTMNASASAPDNCEGDPVNGDLWYKVTSDNSNSDITIAVDAGFGFALIYVQYFDGACGTLNSLGCSFGGLTISPNPNTTYYIRIYEANGGTANFDIQASGNIVLPVTMGKVSAKLTYDNKTRLSWTTYSEQHNHGFSVERSIDGKSFQEAGFVPAQSSGGNSMEVLSYQYTDPVAVGRVAYYRLKQVDMDGKATFSNTVQVTNKMAGDELYIYPNPATDRVILDIKGWNEGLKYNVSVTLTDLSGRILWHPATAAARYDIDMSAFPAGTYLLRYASPENTIVRKLIKNR